MSDFTPETVVDTTASEGVAETPATSDVNWEERYRTEVQDRIKERERYKPFAQTFGKMHPDDAHAVQEFATAFASGDTDTAVRWMIDNARTLAGDRFDTMLTPQQQQNVVNQAVSDGQNANLNANQVEQLINQRFAEVQQMQVQHQYETQIEETLAQHGLSPDTPLATAAIVAASKRPDLDLYAAIREMEEQVMSQAQAIAARRAEAGNSMGTPIINGAGVSNTNSQPMTPRERAMARLEQNGL